jgi:hypothetical protein
MEGNRTNTEIIKFFKMSGLQMRSEVATELWKSYSEINDGKEKRAFLEKILLNIQGQSIQNNSIELDNIKFALRVSIAGEFHSN